MNSNEKQGLNYDGTLYRSIGNFMGECYLNYGFTKGTVQEVDFLVDLLQLPKGSRILDVGCGPGRHSLELARRGYHTVGVDISERFIEIAEGTAKAEGLPAEFHATDAKAIRFEETFDAAICLCEGAFGLAGSDEAHKQILDNMARALRPGGLMVLSAIQAYSAAQERDLHQVFDAYTGTIADNETVSSPGGEKRDVTIYTTTFTFRELKLLAERSGFEVEAGYGCTAGRFERKPLSIDDMEIMIVARKK